MTILSPPRQGTAFRWVTLVLALLAAAAFLPLWAPLVLAAWLAHMVRPLFTKLAKATKGQHRAAGGLVVALVMLILAPLSLAIASLAAGAVDLGRLVLASKGAKSALVAVAAGGDPGAGNTDLSALASPEKLMPLLQEHGPQALKIVSGVLGAAAAGSLSLFVFLYAFYVFLVDGPSYTEWLEKHAPVEVAHTQRLVSAFYETGRGLFVGVGLTGLAQGVVATITYVALGVPRALVLGLLTCVASVIPTVGTTLVWIPVAAGLALAGKPISGAILAGVGLLVIGSVDNLLRPVFSRFGKLDLSNFVLVVSIFGGLAMFGGWGLFLGPLFVRLAKEALTLAHRDRMHEKRGEVDAAKAEAAVDSVEPSAAPT